MGGQSRKDQIRELLAEDPHDPFLRYGLAMEYVSEKNDLEAVACFREMFQLTPDYVPAYMQAGQALVRLDRPDEASEVFRAGIALARQKGNQHAADEMEGMLANLAD